MAPIPLLLAASIHLAAQVAAGAFQDDDPVGRIMANDRPGRTADEKEKDDRMRAPVDLTRSQVLPNDILPYIKAKHWAMFGLEMRANHDDYPGTIVSSPVRLAGQPTEMVYRRDVVLIKKQLARHTLPALLTSIPKEIIFRLTHPDSLRLDDGWPASLRPLESHQQLVVLLTKEPNEAYNRWSNMRALIPSMILREDTQELDRKRYYRMVIPLDPQKPLVSPHPLTWSTVSHVIWDGMPPERLGVGQQQAMLDWLHWGGQLVISGGPGASLASIRDSFLGPYLPAEASGKDASLNGPELHPVVKMFPPDLIDIDEEAVTPFVAGDGDKLVPEPSARPSPEIRTAPGKPIFLTGLRPREGATVIPLGDHDDQPLAVERRVGKGRITMLAISLADPDFVRWSGYSEFVRRLVLRRPADSSIDQESSTLRRRVLGGPELTMVRYLSRDLEVAGSRPADDRLANLRNGGEAESSEPSVGDWDDSARLPSMARTTLENASGIEIPGSGFVLKVMLGYLLALVPINLLVCRYLLKRKEWAWVMVPILSVAFAVGVERAAAYDVGFDSSSDEISLLEINGDYPRGHLSRFASIYSNNRVSYSVSYPKDPSALVLPLATGRSLRGESTQQSSFQSQPFPALGDFTVQPRTLSLFRAEEMVPVSGSLRIEPGDGPDPQASTLRNGLGIDLIDARLVEVLPSDKPGRMAMLGDLASGGSVAIRPFEEIAREAGPNNPPLDPLDPRPFLDMLGRLSVAEHQDQAGELRLVAWTRAIVPGQVITPKVERQRGFTLVVVNLRPGPLPDPAGPRYQFVPIGAASPNPLAPRIATEQFADRPTIATSEGNRP